MKKVLYVLAVSLLAAGFAQAQYIGNDNGTMAPRPPQKQPTSKTLTGTVLNQNDQPLASAVVYIKDTRTLTVRTYISNQNGGYQFNGLDPNRDYDVYAEYKGSHSSHRSVSSFDSRMTPSINLKIEVKPQKSGS